MRQRNRHGAQWLALVCAVVAAACAEPSSSPAGDPDELGPPPLHAVRTASGVAYEIRAAGDGTRPSAWDLVQVRYIAWTSDGAELERADDPPLTVEPRGWAEPLRVLGAGGRARLWIPHDVAGFEVEPAGDLIVDLEVVAVSERPTPPVIASIAPEAATKLRSGTKKVVLAAAPGQEVDGPEPADYVSIHYTAVDAAGFVTSSTIPSARPIHTAVQRFPSVVAEALLSMRLGERAQFWADDPSWAPAFEIELRAVERRAQPRRLSAESIAAPAAATSTRSGTPYRLERVAPRGAPASPRAGVAYHFKAWDPNGRLVASSGSEPIRTRLPFVSTPLRDAIGSMRAGETARFWFERRELGQEVDRFGRLGPTDRVVYEIELVAVKPPRERLSARVVAAVAGSGEETR